MPVTLAGSASNKVRESVDGHDANLTLRIVSGDATATPIDDAPAPRRSADSPPAARPG